jgi:hypothetical protein
MFVENGTFIPVPLPHKPCRGGMLGSRVRREGRNMSPLWGSSVVACVLFCVLQTCHLSEVQKNPVVLPDSCLYPIPVVLENSCLFFIPVIP